MQFGFMEDFRNPEPWARPFPELYNALLDQTIRAEELGYDNVWLTEHHFTADGYNPSLLRDRNGDCYPNQRQFGLGRLFCCCRFSIRFGWRKMPPVSISGQTVGST